MVALKKIEILLDKTPEAEGRRKCVRVHIIPHKIQDPILQRGVGTTHDSQGHPAI